LFSAIKISIQKFYFNYIIATGGVAVPIVSSYLIKLFPDLTSKIAPVIAKLFTPIVLLSLFIYLISLVFSGVPVFEDRNLLMIFNILLVAVMAIIVYSLPAIDRNKSGNINLVFLFCISVLTIVINSIALIAIARRIMDGVTPNRAVVLVSNVLIFIHLILLTISLYKSRFRSNGLGHAKTVISKYLPVYAVWTIVVIFIFPFVFGFK
jgi:hypothetical protein